MLDGVVFTGAGVSWAADMAAARPAQKLMEQAFSFGLPVFGSCYGMQLGVAVLGGRMQANPAGVELAVARQITLTDAGRDHRLYRAKPAIFDALCMHRDDVKDCGPDIQILAGNAHCPIQAVAALSKDISFWGVQYHPELYFSDIAGYLKRSDVAEFSGPPAASYGVSVEQMQADFFALDRQEASDRLKARYDIGADLLKRELHECELANWLAQL